MTVDHNVNVIANRYGAPQLREHLGFRRVQVIRTGNVHLNGAPVDNNAPFGGYKQSGNGREWGMHGFEEFLEVKAIMGYNAAG